MADTKIVFDFEINGKTKSVNFKPTINSVNELIDVMKKLQSTAKSSDVGRLASVVGGSGKMTSELRRALNIAMKNMQGGGSLADAVNSDMAKGFSKLHYKIPINSVPRASKASAFDMEATARYRAKLNSRDEAGILDALKIIRKIINGSSNIIGGINKSSANMAVKSLMGDYRLGKRMEGMPDSGRGFFKHFINETDMMRHNTLGGLRGGGDVKSNGVASEQRKYYTQRMNELRSAMEMASRSGQMTKAVFNSFMNQVKNLDKEVKTTVALAIKSSNSVRKAEQKADATRIKNEEDMSIYSTRSASKLRNMISKEQALLYMRTARYSGVGAPQATGIRNGLIALEEGYRTKLREILNSGAGTRQIKISIDNLFAELGQSFDKLKGDVSKSGKVKAMHMLTSTSNLRTLGGVAGAGLLQLGNGLSQAITSSHMKGQVAGAFSNLITTGLMASWYNVVAEVANIFGRIGEVILEAFMEPIRLIGKLLAGAMKGIGTFLISAGLVMATTIATSFGIPVAGVVTAVVGGIVAMSYAIMQVLSELIESIKSLLGAVMSIVGSIMKIGLMVIVGIVKSFVSIVKGALEAMYGSFKEIFNASLEIAKTSFDMLIKVTRESMVEFANVIEIASRAYKETIPNVGQSVDAFARSMIGLRSQFGFKGQDVGESFFDVVSSGFRNISEAEAMVTASSKLALMSTSDLMTATNAVITVMQNYGKTGLTLDSIIKSIASGSTLGRFTFGELGNSLKSVIGISSRAGVAFDDVMMSLSMLTRTFGRGSIEESTKYLGRFFEAIAMPGTQGRKELEKLGMSFQGMNSAAPTFKNFMGLIKQMSTWSFDNVRKVFTTIQSRRAWMGLTQDIDNYGQLVKDNVEIQANAWQQLELMMNTPIRQYAILTECVKSLMTFWGSTVWSVVGNAFKDVAKIAQQLVGVFQSNAMTGFFKSLVTYLQPMVDTVIVPIRNAFMSLFSVINRGTGSGNNWSKLFDSDIARGIQFIIINIVRAIKSIPAVIGEVFNIITALFPSIGRLGGSVSEVISKIWKYLTSNDYVTWIQDLVKYILNSIEAIYNFITDGGMWSGIFSMIIASMKSIMATIYRLIRMYIEPIFQWLVDASLVAITMICNTLNAKLAGAIIDAFTFVMPYIMGMLGGTVSGLLKLSSGGDSVGKAYENYAKDKLNENVNLDGANNKFNDSMTGGGKAVGIVDQSGKIITQAIMELNTSFKKTGELVGDSWKKSLTDAGNSKSFSSTVSKRIGDTLRNKDGSLRGNEKHSGEMSNVAQNKYDSALSLDASIARQQERVDAQTRNKSSVSNQGYGYGDGENEDMDVNGNRINRNVISRDSMGAGFENNPVHKRLADLKSEREKLGGTTEELRTNAWNEKIANVDPNMDFMTLEQLQAGQAKNADQHGRFVERNESADNNIDNNTGLISGSWDDDESIAGGNRSIRRDLDKNKAKAESDLKFNEYERDKYAEKIEYRKAHPLNPKKAEEMTTGEMGLSSASNARADNRAEIAKTEAELAALEEKKKRDNGIESGMGENNNGAIAEKQKKLAELKEKDTALKAQQDRAKAEVDQQTVFKMLASGLGNTFKKIDSIEKGTTIISNNFTSVMSGGAVSITVGSSSGPASVNGAG